MVNGMNVSGDGRILFVPPIGMGGGIFTRFRSKTKINNKKNSATCNCIILYLSVTLCIASFVFIWKPNDYRLMTIYAIFYRYTLANYYEKQLPISRPVRDLPSRPGPYNWIPPPPITGLIWHRFDGTMPEDGRSPRSADEKWVVIRFPVIDSWGTPALLRWFPLRRLVEALQGRRGRPVMVVVVVEAVVVIVVVVQVLKVTKQVAKLSKNRIVFHNINVPPPSLKIISFLPVVS